MSIDEAFVSLGMSPSSAPAAWRESWARLAVCESAPVPALSPDFWAGPLGHYGLAPDIVDALCAAARAVAAVPALVAVARMWYGLGVVERADAHGWPEPPGAPLLAALATASGFPRMAEGHAKRGIAADVTLANCRDLEIWMRHQRRTQGAWGFREFGWMSNHLAGSLYRLGRLQLIHQPHRGAALAFRNRHSGEVVALSCPGVRYCGTGLVAANHGLACEDAWTATYCEDSTAYRGFPVRPDGHVCPSQLSLARADWSPILEPGSPVLDVHIPEDGPLSPADYSDSFRRAPAFYADHFGDLAPPVAFTCTSWLLDSQFADILPAASNLVHFLREFYLYPVQTGDDAGHFWRVFGERPHDLSVAPRDTTLRRAMLDFALAGGRFVNAGGLIPIEAATGRPCRSECYWRGDNPGSDLLS